MAASLDIDVIYITFNEAVNLPYSLETVHRWANRVFVVDSGSTDRTCELAHAYGARAVHHPWPGYPHQKNWALANLPLTASWVLLLDADEAVQPDLYEALQRIAEQPVDAVEESAFHVNRYFLFLGKPIWRCGYYPSWNIRLFKRGRAQYEARTVHEHMLVDGAVGYLSGHLEHWDRRGVSYWNKKHSEYAELEAYELYKLSHGPSQQEPAPKLTGSPAERVRWIKHYLYPRLPAKWLCRFLYMYVLKRGFLDGLTGFRFCLFVAAYELMIELNLLEYQRGLKTPPE